MNPTKPLKHKKQHFFGAAHIPSKNSFGPQFGSLYGQPKTRDKSEIKVQTKGKLGMTLWKSL
jgi:hypothetical protein